MRPAKPAARNRPGAALVRRPLGDPATAELTFQTAVPVDPDRLARQHAAYVEVLAGLGLRIVEAPPLPEHPDAVFVEDAVVVVDDLAVLTRPGAASRRDEVASLRGPLEDRGLEIVELAGDGTLDGGDVLQLDDRVLVGRSTRTDDAGIAALRSALADRGRAVEAVDVHGALHLKTAVTGLPDGRLVARPGAVDLDHLARTVVAAPEPTGANVVVVGTTVVLSASAPRTADLLRRGGTEVVTVTIDELEKLEAGPSCCCVLLPH